MFCGNCGFRIDDGCTVCPNCGSPVGPALQAAPQEAFAAKQQRPEPMSWQQPVPPSVPLGALKEQNWQPEQTSDYGQQGPAFEPMGQPRPAFDSQFASQAEREPQQPATDAKGRPLRSRGPAVAALICAVLSALTCFFPFASLPLALLGLICGILGRRSEERSMATVALVISIVFLIWNVTVVIIAMIFMNKYGFDLNHIRYFVEQYFRNFFH